MGDRPWPVIPMDPNPWADVRTALLMRIRIRMRTRRRMMMIIGNHVYNEAQGYLKRRPFTSQGVPSVMSIGKG